MRQVLFIQGAGKDVHDTWDDKLVASLRRELGGGYDVRYPRMPDEAFPELVAWQGAIDHELAALGDGSVVIGHSIGGTILVQALVQRPPAARLAAIVLLAAPFLGPGGWQTDAESPNSELAAGLPSDVPVLLFHGDCDKHVAVEHAALYARAIPHAEVHRLPGRDHQLDNDLSEVAAAVQRLG